MHPKLLYFRYKLFRYRLHEQKIASTSSRLLDIGCGDGENMLRFEQQHLARVGVEVSLPRLETARKHGLSVQQASGTNLPFADNSFDMIYVAHVLHHIEDYERVLAEMRRVGSAETRFFIVETVTDNPLLRLARRVHPVWQGDNVEADWRFAQLRTIFETAGFKVERYGRYNVLFFLWEMVPLAFWPLELFTPIFVYLDLLLARVFYPFSAHCYFELTASEAQ